MKFGFVAKHRGAWPVNLMCEALGVSRGGFYAWLTRPRSQRSLSDEVLGAQVHQSFVRSDRTYGARRVWHDVLEQGQACGLHRIERLMREQALRARPRRRGLPKDRGTRSAVTDNVLDRQFRADGRKRLLNTPLTVLLMQQVATDAAAAQRSGCFSAWAGA